MSQFAFLSPNSPRSTTMQKAESDALSDPRAACFSARLALETPSNGCMNATRRCARPMTKRFRLNS